MNTTTKPTTSMLHPGGWRKGLILAGEGVEVQAGGVRDPGKEDHAFSLFPNNGKAAGIPKGGLLARGPSSGSLRRHHMLNILLVKLTSMAVAVLVFMCAFNIGMPSSKLGSSRRLAEAGDRNPPSLSSACAETGTSEDDGGSVSGGGTEGQAFTAQVPQETTSTDGAVSVDVRAAPLQQSSSPGETALQTLQGMKWYSYDFFLPYSSPAPTEGHPFAVPLSSEAADPVREQGSPVPGALSRTSSLSSSSSSSSDSTVSDSDAEDSAEASSPDRHNPFQSPWYLLRWLGSHIFIPGEDNKGTVGSDGLGPSPSSPPPISGSSPLMSTRESESRTSFPSLSSLSSDVPPALSQSSISSRVTPFSSDDMVSSRSTGASPNPWWLSNWLGDRLLKRRAASELNQSMEGSNTLQSPASRLELGGPGRAPVLASTPPQSPGSPAVNSPLSMDSGPPVLSPVGLLSPRMFRSPGSAELSAPILSPIVPLSDPSNEGEDDDSPPPAKKQRMESPLQED